MGANWGAQFPLGTLRWGQRWDQPLPSTPRDDATLSPCNPRICGLFLPLRPPPQELTPCPRSHPPPGMSPPCCPAASASPPPSCGRAGGRCRCTRSRSWLGVLCKVLGRGPLPSQRGTGSVPPRALGDRGFMPAHANCCPVPCLSFPIRGTWVWGSGGPGDSPQEVAEGVEEAGEHGRQHQLRENWGVSEATGVPRTACFPPPPQTYHVLLAAPHHVEEEIDAAPVDDGESFQTGDLPYTGDTGTRDSGKVPRDCAGGGAAPSPKPPPSALNLLQPRAPCDCKNSHVGHPPPPPAHHPSGGSC